jgi:hypothetical protein
MTIYYLYVKTHKITGLKYLGQTKQQDPHKYSGSGIRWINHLKKHGYNYTTEILRECQTKDEIKEYGLYYSQLWNIVESNEWANLKLENGDGGAQSSKSIAKIQETKRKNGTLSSSPEIIAKMVGTRRKNGTYGIPHKTHKSPGPRSPETTAKIIKTRRKNGTLIPSPETLLKMHEARKRNGTLRPSPETIFKMQEARKKNGPLKQTPESIAKMLETKRKNGTLNTSSPEAVSKRRETKLKRWGTVNNLEIKRLKELNQK